MKPNRVFRINFHESKEKKFAAALKKVTKFPSLPPTKRGNEPIAKNGAKSKADKTIVLKRSQVISPYL